MRPSIHEPRPSQRFRWLLAAALVPVLVLAALAFLGARAQRDAALQGARREAVATAVLVAEWLAAELPAAIETAPLIDDPPQPRPDATMEIVDQAAGDAGALRALRDDPDAGFSPAGLPIRILAGLRLWEKTKDPQDAAALATLAADEAASVLSPTIFDRLGDADRAAAWQRGARARTALRQHPGIDAQGRWIPTADGWLWLARGQNQVRFLTTERFQDLATPTAIDLPAWANWRVAWDGLPATGDEVLARRAVAFAGSPLVEITEKRPGLILEAARRNEFWTSLLLVAAAACAAAALAAMRRAITRERKLGELKSQFVSSVSHELRAPVGSIRLMAEALHGGRVKDAAARDFTRLIASEGARLGHLIENVLDLTRIDEGRKRYHPEECDLHAVAADAARLITPHAEAKQVRLATRLCEANARIDSAAIQQALLNLLDNALKFSPPGGTITLTLDASPSGGWLLRVGDEGPGIPPAERQRVFERFHRLGNELRRETQGCGIGLSIVKSIVEAHGGRVAIADTPPPGTTVEIHLPERT
jgi:signal transduction histidine kinase